LPIPKTRFDRSRLLYFFPVLQKTPYNHFARTSRKAPSSIFKHACLLVLYLAINVLLSSALVLWECIYRPVA
jgi:hypothetical protein